MIDVSKLRGFPPHASSNSGLRAKAIFHCGGPFTMTACLNRKELTMSRQFLIAAATWTLLGTTIGRAQSPGSDVSTET